MKTDTRMQVLFVAAAMVAGGVWASGPHKAVLYPASGGNPMQGDVSWLPASKAYKIAAGSVMREVPARDVAAVKLIQPPSNLKSAISSGNIAQLKQIMDDYEMFGPDLEAAQALIQAYIRNNQAAEAVRLCESLFRKNDKMESSAEVQLAYWEALRKAGMGAKLSQALVKALQTGERPLQAVACLQRGHLERDQGDMRKALVDGYLRCVVLYQNVQLVQPEALYWAFKSHQALNEHSYAEKWRTKLMGGYPRSEWARKLQTN
jgi:tetratricopeptide (TPR) repeat protein